MKKIEQKILWAFLAICFSLLSTGCSDKKSQNTSTDDTVIKTDTPSDPHWDDYNEGSVVNFKIYSIKRFNSYANESYNSPKNVQINVNLEKVSEDGKTYKGSLRFGFEDHGLQRNGYLGGIEFFEHEFETGGIGMWNGRSESTSARYNYWYTDKKLEKKVFKAFFQDEEGPIILIIDKIKSVGDGQEPKVGSGSLWFKRFPAAQASQSPTVCWLISKGPFDCRPWKSGKKLDVERSITPDNGYKKLGTFENLDLHKAFDGEDDYEDYEDEDYDA